MTPIESSILEIVQQSPKGVMMDKAVMKVRAQTGYGAQIIALTVNRMVAQKTIRKDQDGMLTTTRTPMHATNHVKAASQVATKTGANVNGYKAPAQAKKKTPRPAKRKERKSVRGQQVWELMTTPKTTKQVAQETGIDRAYVSQIIRRLFEKDRLQRLWYDMEAGGWLYLQAGLVAPKEPVKQAEAKVKAEVAEWLEKSKEKENYAEGLAFCPPAEKAEKVESKKPDLTRDDQPGGNPMKESRLIIQDGTKAYRYLEKIVEEEGYGDRPSQVMERLVWEGIRRLIVTGLIDRIVDEGDD